MGLFDSMINILGKTVAQGVGSVVEKAVSEAVKPAVTKFAQKQADLIDSVSREIENASESVKKAGEELDQAAQQSPEQLSAAMEFLRQNARRAAEEIEKMEANAIPTDEEVMAKWDELLSDYPKWNCGGNNFQLEEDRLGDDSGQCIRFYLNATEANYIAYRAVLASEGFRMKYRSDTSTWYKEVDGRYPAVNLFHVDDDACEMILIFYQESREEILEAAKL